MNMFSYLQVFLALVQFWCATLITGMEVSPRIKHLDDQRFSKNTGEEYKPLLSNQDSPFDTIRDHTPRGREAWDVSLQLGQKIGFAIGNDRQGADPQSISPLKKRIKTFELLNTKKRYKDQQRSTLLLEDIFGAPKWKEAEIEISDVRKSKLDQVDTVKLREDLVQMTSEEFIRKWLEKGLNLKLLYWMLELMYIRNPLGDIGAIASEVPIGTWLELRKLWRASKHQWDLAEIQISTLLTDKIDAQRRILAFHRLLHRTTVAMRWSQFTCQQKALRNTQLDELNDLEDAYGMTDKSNFDANKVGNIPKKHWHWDTKVGIGGNWTAGKILTAVCGKHEASRRQELHDYKMARNSGFGLLWLQRVLVKYRAQQFGVDILVACKIADSLQLYSYRLLDDAFGRMSFDQSFSQLFEVFVEQGREFPGLKSPEQVWFGGVWNSLYKDRLITLAGSINLSSDKSPLSTATIKKYLQDEKIFEGNTPVSSMEVLLWAGFGLDLYEWPRIWQIRNSPGGEKVNDLKIGLSKMSDAERKILTEWHTALYEHHTQLTGPERLSRYRLKYWQWIYEYTIPWIIIKRRTWQILKETFDQLNPWACTNRHRKPAEVSRAIHRSIRKNGIATSVQYY